MRFFCCTNTILASNTYLLCNDKSDEVYIVDPGDIPPILNWLNSHKKKLKGIFLTHAHYDHMYGLNKLLEYFPCSSLFVSSKMIDSLYSIKLNTSLYHEKPYSLDKLYSKNISLFEDNSVLLLWEYEKMTIVYTPGHTNDSHSFSIGNYLFTGDALIPGIKVYHRNKMGNYADVISSIDRIFKTFCQNTIILPGHGYHCLLRDSKSKEYFGKLQTNIGFIEV